MKSRRLITQFSLCRQLFVSTFANRNMCLPVFLIPIFLFLAQSVSAQTLSIGLEGPLSVDKNKINKINSFRITDTEINANPNAQFSITFSVSNGTLSLGDMTGRSVTIINTLNEIYSLLLTGGLSYQPDIDFAETDTLTIVVQGTADDERSITKNIAIHVKRELKLIMNSESQTAPSNRILPGNELTFQVHLSNFKDVLGFRIVLQINSQEVAYIDDSAAFDGNPQISDWVGDIRVKKETVEGVNRLIFTSFSQRPMNENEGTLFQFKLKAADQIKQDAMVSLIFNVDETELNEGEIGVAPINFEARTRFLWGDVSANRKTGATDASLILQSLIDPTFTFPVQDNEGYTKIDGTDLPQVADVNGDSLVGTVDASLIMDKYIFLIDSFDAVDTNKDGWGPDTTTQAKTRNRNLHVINNEITPKHLLSKYEPVFNSHGGIEAWNIVFSIDNADELRGLFFEMQYDSNEILISQNDVQSLITTSSVISEINTESRGILKIASSFSPPLQGSDIELFSLSIKNHPLSTTNNPSITISVLNDKTKLNDGSIALHANSVSDIVLPLHNHATPVDGWMLY